MKQISCIYVVLTNRFFIFKNVFVKEIFFGYLFVLYNECVDGEDWLDEDDFVEDGDEDVDCELVSVDFW